MSELVNELGEADMRSALRDAARQMGVRSISDGSWFRKLVAKHVQTHSQKVDRHHFDRVYSGLGVEERAQAEIRRVSLKAAAAGVAASVGASTGELLSFFTDGLAAPIGVPAAILAMGLEAAYTALLQIDLACDLGLIYETPFDPGDVGEIATLFGLALDLDVYAKPKHGEPSEQAHGLTERLHHLEEGEIAGRIGRKLLEESLLSNIIPVIGVAISGRWNFVGTKTFGAKVRKYMRYRRAIKAAVRELRLGHAVDPAVLVEGAWLLSTVDGEAGHEEMLAIAALVDMLTPEQRTVINKDSLGENEEAWFARLPAVDAAMQPVLLDTLYLVAAADRELAVPERRFLQRIGKALGREIDLARVQRICEHLQEGEPPPPAVWAS